MLWPASVSPQPVIVDEAPLSGVVFLPVNRVNGMFDTGEGSLRIATSKVERIYSPQGMDGDGGDIDTRSRPRL